MKNKKGNISILVIFILLASSLIGILTSNYVRELLSYSDGISKYYKTYYISKGGLELALAQINNRGVGFQYKISSGDDISNSNFLFTGASSFVSDIHGVDPKISKSFDQSTGCKYPFSLSGGDSVVLPLFKDIFNGSVVDSLTGKIEYRNLAFNLTNAKVKTEDMNKKINLGIIFLSGGDIHDQGFFFKSLLLNETSITDFIKQFESYARDIFIDNKSLVDYYQKDEIFKDNYMRSYLVLSNPQNQSNVKFCVSVDEQIGNVGNNVLALPYYYVKVIGKTADFLLGLDSQISQPIPSFLANISSEF